MTDYFLSDTTKANSKETEVEENELNTSEETEASSSNQSDTVSHQNVKALLNLITIEETVDEILKSMPKDFFDFWKFCQTISKSKPQGNIFFTLFVCHSVLLSLVFLLNTLMVFNFIFIKPNFKVN